MCGCLCVRVHVRMCVCVCVGLVACASVFCCMCMYVFKYFNHEKNELMYSKLKFDFDNRWRFKRRNLTILL